MIRVAVREEEEEVEVEFEFEVLQLVVALRTTTYHLLLTTYYLPLTNLSSKSTTSPEASFQASVMVEYFFGIRFVLTCFLEFSSSA